MDITRLNYFLTLAHTQSLREAADILSVTAPALSKAMKVLEDEMGVELWMRDGRRSVLTDEGKILLREAPKIIDGLRDIKMQLLNHKKILRPIKIGTFEVFSTYFPQFLENVKWKDQSIELHELLPGEIERYLSEGEIDVGISYMPIPDSQLDFLKVTSVEMGVYVKKGAFKGVQQPDIPFVVPVTPLQGVPTKVKGLDGWPDHGYERTVNFKVTLMESALELCRQGRVAGYFPGFIVREHNKRIKEDLHLVRKYFPNAESSCFTDVFIIKRKSTQEDKRIKQLARAIRSIAR